MLEAGIGRLVAFSSLRLGNSPKKICRGCLLNFECFTKFSTDASKYSKQWSFSSKLQQFQPIQRLSQLAQNVDNGRPDGSAEGENLSIFQRFKKTYKEHGKVLVGVHVATSLVWYGSFYLILSSGFDLAGFLESVDWNERVVKPLEYVNIEVSLERIEKFVQVLKNSGNYAGAYLMYKIATPARYTVTLGGTNIAIKYLRKSGKIPPVKEPDRLGHLMKESRAEIESRMKKRMALEKGRYATLKAQRLGNKKKGQLLMKAQEFYQKQSGTKNGTVKRQWLSQAKEYYKKRKNQRNRTT
ncbi:uncharacterized protein LOC111136550 [Crassostrea virginica]